MGSFSSAKPILKLLIEMLDEDLFETLIVQTTISGENILHSDKALKRIDWFGTYLKDELFNKLVLEGNNILELVVRFGLNY